MMERNVAKAHEAGGDQEKLQEGRAGAHEAQGGEVATHSV